ncbi:MAG: acylphosphatase [Gammaproteobacteria bacterium]|nr:acylphosphatase [Gammaproteobacteria bacterium]MDH4314956.1 acylphosphatase [Gammaproteobacteria bacterium]MDH5214163.1 acylphosphatase [Gammaproteobacteria bacterium]MDH5501509.1 acylphosphatase [Gammaproteobacteria bacterium]
MKQDSEIQCRRFVVRGKVQGVFFRASTRDVAHSLGVTGHAINLPDGSVEVVACGKPAALLSLRNWLRDGPALAKVESLDEGPVEISAPRRFTTG